jgi:hypothetical protein
MCSPVRAYALAAVLGAAALATSPATASNQTSETVGHPFERVWPAAVRFIRVDAGHPIEEKDADTGYILFTYAHEGREFRGALEVIRIRDDRGRDAVRLVLRIDKRPSYLERALLNRLMRKLRDELGRPPPPPPEDDGEDDGDAEGDGEPEAEALAR